MRSRYFRAFIIWSCLCPHNFTLLLQPSLVCVVWFAGQQHRWKEQRVWVRSRSCGCVLPQAILCLKIPVATHQDGRAGWGSSRGQAQEGDQMCISCYRCLCSLLVFIQRLKAFTHISLNLSSLIEEGLSPGFWNWLYSNSLMSIQLCLHIRFLNQLEWKKIDRVVPFASWSPLGGDLSWQDCATPVGWERMKGSGVAWRGKIHSTLAPSFPLKGHLSENMSWCASSGWAQPNPADMGCREAGGQIFAVFLLPGHPVTPHPHTITHVHTHRFP